MSSDYLTTGQAADILAVTPDTVLKWIRSGRLPARRTPGGHHRINRRDIDLVIAEIREARDITTSEPRRSFEYCWEYYGSGGLPEDCHRCAVYLMRARRCYEVAKLAPQSGHLKAFCKDGCEDCDYFRLVYEQRTNVLVVTDDEMLSASLSRDARSADFNLEIVECEYCCASKINDFRPDFAVVDCSRGHEASSEIVRHLVRDPRIPLVRVVLAGKDGEFPEECDKEIFARMERPFGVREIQEIIICLNKEDREGSD